MATPERLDEFFKMSARFAEQNKAQIQQMWREQRLLEAKIINDTDSLCPLKQLEDKFITSETIEAALMHGFGDSSVLKALMCLNNSLEVLPNSAGLERNYKIRNYIRSLRQIGAESVAGYAMASKVGVPVGGPDDNAEPFVVKAPRAMNTNTNSEQIHEYFVGAFGTNQLRSFIPTFAYMMGMFKCSPPYVDEKRVLAFCQNNDPKSQVAYLLYENVRNSTTFKDFVAKGCSVEDYLNILTQVVFGLQLAYDTCKFQHGDLHDENILVETLPHDIYIPYNINEKIIYLKTRHVARIIDLGRSYIEYEGKSFGFSFYEIGLYLDTSYPMYDVYKIIMFSLSNAKETNRQVYDVVKDVVKSFDPTVVDIDDHLDKTRKFYYSLLFDQYFSITPLDYLNRELTGRFDHIFANFLTEQKPFDENVVYGCATKGVCLTLQQAIEAIEETPYEDPYVFYELMQSNPSEELYSIGQLRAQEYVKILCDKLNEAYNSYSDIVNSMQVMSIAVQGQEAYMFSDQYLRLYRDHIAKVASAFDLQTTIIGLVTMINYFDRTFGVVDHPNLDRYQVYAPSLLEAKDHLMHDKSYINSLGGKRAVESINPRAGWVYDKLSSLQFAVA